MIGMLSSSMILVMDSKYEFANHDWQSIMGHDAQSNTFLVFLQQLQHFIWTVFISSYIISSDFNCYLLPLDL